MATSLRLPNDIEARLTALAAHTGRSKTFYILEAVSQHLDDLEDIYLAQGELEAVRAGRSSTESLDSVMNDYGLVG